MIFIVTYKNDIEAVFFHIWDAQQYINRFDRSEWDYFDIARVSEQDNLNLQNLKSNLQIAKDNTQNDDHCCGNCGRAKWNNNLFVCDFTHEEANPNDICSHYI